MALNLNRLGRLRDCRGGGTGGARLVFGLANVDATFEEGAIFNADARSSHIAGQGAFRADVDAIRSRHIAANFAQNDNFAGGNAGRHLAVAAHGYAVAGETDAALDLAIDKERLRAGNLA